MVLTDNSPQHGPNFRAHDRGSDCGSWLVKSRKESSRPHYSV